MITKLDDNKTLHKILKYYYIDNVTQQEIADKLNISRIKVIRYINYAKENGLIEVKLNIPLKDTFELESRVEAAYNLRECRIVHSFSNENEIYKYAGIELADLLKRLLKKDMYVGVSWSQSFRNVIEYTNPVKKMPLNVVPIIGGLELDGTITNSNTIAHIFTEKAGGVNYTINIPAVFDSMEAKDIIENEWHTKKIKELADKIELVITGVGDMSISGTIFKSGYFKLAERNYLDSLKIAAIINLNFIDAKGEEVKTDIDKRIIKIFTLERFKKLDNVIGIAFGENKVNPIKAALNGKILKYLITDEDTAKKLLE
jgi:DNA-binding transcriptional regulator LsrR (DeoR family)